MSYSTLYKLKERKTNTIPDSLNDPYNKFSYKMNTMENFIPLNYGGMTKKDQKQTELSHIDSIVQQLQDKVLLQSM